MYGDEDSYVEESQTGHSYGVLLGAKAERDDFSLGHECWQFEEDEENKDA